MLKHFREQCHQYKMGSYSFFIETNLFFFIPPPLPTTIKDQGRRLRTGERNLEEGWGVRVGMKHTKEISTFINIKSLIFFTLFLNSSKVLGPLLVFPWRAFSTCSRTTSNTFLKSSLINTCIILCFLYFSF